MDPVDKQKDIERLKNELREKLLRKKLAKGNQIRLGFGGRVISNGGTESVEGNEWKDDQDTSNHDIQRNDMQSHEMHNLINDDHVSHILAQKPGFGLSQISQGGHPFGQNYSGDTPQPSFILDDERRVLMTPKAFKAKMKRARKAHEDSAALKEQKLLRLKAKQKADRLSKNKTKYDNCDRVLINSVVYAVAENGITLAPLLDPDSETSEYLMWNNWRYARNRYGVLKRNIRAQARPQCRYFSRTGMCQKGVHCRYVHDMNRVVLCRQFVMGKCEQECIYSHERTEFNTPICRFHLENSCHNPQCRYVHRVPRHAQDNNYSVWTCRPFAVGGWCLRGSMCPFLHLYNCPDFEEVGLCPRGKNCSLAHVVTKRIQELMTTPQDTSGVVVARDSDSKTLINSYSVDPAMLFVRPETSGFYVDEEDVEQDDSQLVIHLGSSEGEEGEEGKKEDEEEGEEEKGEWEEEQEGKREGGVAENGDSSLKE